MAINLKSVLGKLFVNDKQIVTLDDTAENGAIESGSNANGDYTKFPNGTLICYGLTPSIATSTEVTTGFWHTGAQTGDLPQTFVGGIYIVASPKIGQGYSFGHNIEVAGQSAFAWRGFGINSGQHVSLQWQAIGRWK